MNPRSQIQFDLLANARDSLTRAVELVAWKDIQSEDVRLKHAITNAAHSIELLLKERLKRVHPELVWEGVDKARTVNVDKAISRLMKIGNIELADNDIFILRSLRATRNAIEHYEWNTTVKEAKIIVGNALSFALSFADEHLDADLAAEFKKDDTWHMLIGELYDFARAHAARIEKKLREKGDWPSCCDACGEQTVPMRGRSCELCGHWQVVDDD